MIFENIRTGLNSLKAQKTTLAVNIVILAISSSLFMAGLAIHNGITQLNNKSQENYGENTFFVEPAKPNLQPTSPLYPSVLNVNSITHLNALTLRDFNNLRNNNTIKSSAAYSIFAGNIRVNKTNKLTSIISASPDFMDLMSLKIQSGQKFSSVKNTEVAIIGNDLAKSLFDEDSAIGQTVVVNKQQFTIIGILQDKLTPANTRNTATATTTISSSILVPIDSIKQLTGREQYFDGLIYQLQDNINITSANSKIVKQLAKEHSQQGSFDIKNAKQLTDKSLIALRTPMYAYIGLIGLVVIMVGLGFLNFTRVNILARSREFAIRKTVGASNLQIMVQLITEVFFVGFFGAILGVILSMGVIYWTNHTRVTPVYSIENLFFTLMFGVLISTLFSLPVIFAATKKNVIHSE